MAHASTCSGCPECNEHFAAILSMDAASVTRLNSQRNDQIAELHRQRKAPTVPRQLRTSCPPKPVSVTPADILAVLGVSKAADSVPTAPDFVAAMSTDSSSPDRLDAGLRAGRSPIAASIPVAPVSDAPPAPDFVAAFSK